MSSKERLAAVFDKILERLDSIDQKLEALGALDNVVNDLQTIAIDVRADLDTLRSRQIEQTSRDGEVIHRHQREIQELDARLTKHERAVAARPPTS